MFSSLNSLTLIRQIVVRSNWPCSLSALFYIAKSDWPMIKYTIWLYVISFLKMILHFQCLCDKTTNQILISINIKNVPVQYISSFFHSWSRHEKTCIKKHSSFFLVNFYYISNVEAICLYHKIWIIKFKKRNIAWTDESKMVSYTCVLAWQKKYCIRTV